MKKVFFVFLFLFLIPISYADNFVNIEWENLYINLTFDDNETISHILEPSFTNCADSEYYYLKWLGKQPIYPIDFSYLANSTIVNVNTKTPSYAIGWARNQTICNYGLTTSYYLNSSNYTSIYPRPFIMETGIGGIRFDYFYNKSHYNTQVQFESNKTPSYIKAILNSSGKWTITNQFGAPTCTLSTESYPNQIEEVAFIFYPTIPGYSFYLNGICEPCCLVKGTESLDIEEYELNNFQLVYYSSIAKDNYEFFFDNIEMGSINKINGLTLTDIISETIPSSETLNVDIYQETTGLIEILGFKSQGSKYFLGLIIMLIATIGMILLGVKAGITADWFIFGVLILDFFLSIFLIFLKLLPFWLLIIYAIIGIFAIAFFFLRRGD